MNRPMINICLFFQLVLSVTSQLFLKTYVRQVREACSFKRVIRSTHCKNVIGTEIEFEYKQSYVVITSRLRVSVLRFHHIYMLLNICFKLFVFPSFCFTFCVTLESESSVKFEEDFLKFHNPCFKRWFRVYMGGEQ